MEPAGLRSKFNLTNKYESMAVAFLELMSVGEILLYPPERVHDRKALEITLNVAARFGVVAGAVPRNRWSKIVC